MVGTELGTLASEVGPLRFGRLRHFVMAFGRLIDGNPAESTILAAGGALLGDLVRHDDWLPPPYAQHSAAHYMQYLLHCDGAERFSVVSFVWGPNQETPVHDHTVWGLVGMLRGAELVQSYSRADGVVAPVGHPSRLRPGEVSTISPMMGDIHQVRNALADQPSISIHVYGANIGAVRRSVFLSDGSSKTFVSGYANDSVPNIWRISDA